MDKDSYETYEYLTDNSTGSQSNQFYVVQDDNTFLINRPIQYVTQVQHVKEDLDTVHPGCTVYDASSQQFYVDVDNNSELTEPDEFILPGRSNNIDANSFLLQSVCNATESMETDVPMEQNNIEQEITQTNADNIDKKQLQSNTLTEITLSDEQYKMWEQNGWILLEINEKIFYLDTLGLHDITNDENMIKKLKSLVTSSTKKQHNISLTKSENIGPSNYNIVSTQHTEGSMFANEGSENETHSEDMDQEVKQSLPKVKYEIPEEIPEYVSPAGNNTTSTELEEHRQTIKNIPEKSTIRLKTNYTFKSVPEKIYLGKTSKGKRLVAKVVRAKGVQIIRSPVPTNESENVSTKVVHNQEIRDENISISIPTLESENVAAEVVQNQGGGEENISVSVNSDLAQELRLQKLFEEWVSALAEVKASTEAIEETRHLVAHLLKLPAIRPSLLHRQLVVTKVIKFYTDANDTHKGNQPYMVAGVVVGVNGKFVFHHKPNMLRDILGNIDAKKNGDEAQASRSVLHIHLSETRNADNTRHTSMLLKKRTLPLKRPKKYSSNSVFACGTCAAIYTTEDELREHQETHSLDSEDTLTIDTDNTVNNIYEVIDIHGGKLYACTQCDLQFNRLTNCQSHVKVHQSLKENALNNKDSNGSINQPDTVYRCKMCPAIYRHTATLAKHIANKHIKVK